MTDRRTFIGVAAGGLLVSPLAAMAQPTTKVAQIGWLTPEVLEVHTRALGDAMRALGHEEEGKSYHVVEARSADDNIDRLPALAAELVRANVDLIVAVGPPAILAARQATATIPIVMAFWGRGGLLESGLVANMARPGGNVTGVSMLAAELDAKRLELLLQAVPKARKVGVLDPGRGFTLTDVQRFADGVGAQLVVASVANGKGRLPSGLRCDGAGASRCSAGAVASTVLQGRAQDHRSRGIADACRRSTNGRQWRKTEV